MFFTVFLFVSSEFAESSRLPFTETDKVPLKALHIDILAITKFETPAGGESTCSIAGQVQIVHPFEGGVVTLTEKYLNSARMPATKVIANYTLDKGGVFEFLDLSPGKYVLDASYYNSEKGPLTYDRGSYYYYLTRYSYVWNEEVSLSLGQHVKIGFAEKEEKAVTNNQYVNSSNYYATDPYSPYSSSGDYVPPVYTNEPYSPYTNINTPENLPYSQASNTPDNPAYTNINTPSYSPYENINNPSYNPYTNINTPTYTPYDNSAAPYSPYDSTKKY